MQVFIVSRRIFLKELKRTVILSHHSKQASAFCKKYVNFQTNRKLEKPSNLNINCACSLRTRQHFFNGSDTFLPAPQS